MNEEFDSQVQVSADGTTVWIHTPDGSTVGRFSTRFGMDVHTTASDQLNGASQCLHCTHKKPGRIEWLEFCALIEMHYGIKVNVNLLSFT